MKTFKDLEFGPHQAGSGKIASMNFDNGYGISVVRFKLMIGNMYGSYTDNDQEWEVAVLKDDELTYDTPITDDVIGHCSRERVEELMTQIQELT